MLLNWRWTLRRWPTRSNLAVIIPEPCPKSRRMHSFAHSYMQPVASELHVVTSGFSKTIAASSFRMNYAVYFKVCIVHFVPHSQARWLTCARVFGHRLRTRG